MRTSEVNKLPSIIELTLLWIRAAFTGKRVSYNLNANAKLERVCWHTLPEIRTEITRLFERKKGSDKDDIGS